jgi:DNA-binding transcriptional ArsR family regulator
MGLGWGETAYHLRRLTESGAVARERGGRRDYYFLRETSAADRRILVAFQTPVERTILLALLDEAPVSFAELVERVPLPRSTLAFHLRWLLSSGLVESVREGASRRYRAVSRLRARELAAQYPSADTRRLSDRFTDTWGGLVRD